LRYDGKGYFIRHDGGDVKISYKAVLPELREYYKKQASYLTPEQKGAEAEEPPGPDDLATRSGRIYRNVVVKQIDDYAVYFQHDGGSARVYFSDIPDKAARDKYRTATPVAPDVPPGTNDLVASDGQVFRNVDIRRVEPDGLTFRHDGGVTKLRFPALSEELQKKYEYDPKAAAKYQRDLAAEKKRLKDEEAVRRALNSSSRRKTRASRCRSKSFRSSPSSCPTRIPHHFRGAEPDGQDAGRRGIPYDSGGKALMGGKRFKVPPKARVEDMDVVVPMVSPRELRIYCGSFQTNRLLHW
jgi:hypothetical protein